MKKLTSIFLAAILFVSAGCKKDFFDINENPNLPTDESLTPELLLPRAIVRAAAKTTTSYSNYAGWMGYWARSGTYGGSQSTEGYTLTADFEQDEWEGWYDILFDFNTAEKKAIATNKSYYAGMAKVFKAIGFMYLVDQYNNVPYTKAFDVVGNLTPAYDKGPDVYADLIKQLDQAIAIFETEGVDADPGIPAIDIVFGGDPEQWARFANTQKLKLLIHQSGVISAAAAKTELDKTAGTGYLDGASRFSLTSHDDGAYVNPGYVADEFKQNPFWDSYDTDFTGSQVNDYWRANNFALNQIYGLNGATFSDPRGAKVFDAARTVLNGATYSGANFGQVTPNTGPQAINQSDVSGPGLAYGATQSQWIFTVPESLFLQAEAAQRGWITGSAESLYEDAVSSSFIFLNLTQTQADDYLASSKGSWSANANKIKLIATQKYYAMTGINNFEGWVDYRRLDDAEAILSSSAEQAALLSFSPARNGKQIPLRLIYAQSEYNYNAANVAAEGVIDPQNNRIFWDAKKR